MQVRIYALAIAAMTLGTSATAFAQADDVVVDGRIITGESYASAAAPRAVDPGFAGGVFVASGDSAAKGKTPGFSAYDSRFQGGVRVAGGDAIGGHNTGALRNVSGDSASGGSRHTGGANFLLGDGSVRFDEPQAGKDEIITTSGNRAEGTKVGSLGSLKGMSSIGQLSAPPGAGQPTGAQNNLKQLGLASLNYDPTGVKGDDGIADVVVGAGPTGHVKVFDGRAAGPGSGPHVKVFDGARNVGPQVGGAPHVKAFDGSTDAAASASGIMALKGKTIKQN